MITVAIIDSGVDLAHPWFMAHDLAASVVRRDFTGEDDLQDLGGHGTFHCGQVTRLAGQPVRLLVARVVGANDTAAPDHVVEALSWAREEGALLISIGLGAPCSTAALELAVHTCAETALVIAPVGNQLCRERLDGDDPRVFRTCALLPARLPSVLGVGLAAGPGVVATSDCAGMDVRFAGADIEGPAPGGRVVSRASTSVAAARASGVAARILLADADLRDATRSGRGHSLMVARLLAEAMARPALASSFEIH
ncbi:Alkaline protease precursor [Enhygromyxa salina]|uniref:Alkaline protease n=1 Tax=Enhygromyxa salina TaxID=215803 RepID=A0A0C2A7G3_9BACT|nr:S8 family serine peptidase [Enhygromyxa salina]KIG19468.1 Alkaline protease precursor [Enhygromyxa salina]